MTSLQITPKWKDKSARFRGAIAAGEHVAVTIANDDGEGNPFITSTENLRLRVVGPDGRTLAVFPEPVEEDETPEAWDTDTTPLSCTLNLNTVQMLKAVPPAANVPLLFVLDDYESKTLYFKDMCEVTHWPRRVGEEEPLDLDGYRDFVEETESRLSVFNARLEELGGQVEASAASAAASARDAADSADSAERALAAAQSAASTAQEIASSKADLVDGKVPSSQLPAYVDDVLEFATLSDFPSPGMEGKIYVAKDTNKTYRWSGTQYTEIANPTLDNDVTKNSANGVKSSGIWAAIWGALTALPTGFTSLYDWCVSQLAGKLSLSGGTMDRLAKITWSNSFPGSATYSISRDGISSRSELPSSNWTKPWYDIAEISKTVPTSRTVNDTPLSSDVTLTGADIAVSGTDATKIDAALAGKASTADATLTARFSAWTLSGDVEAGSQYEVRFDYDNEGTTLWGLYKDGDLFSTGSDNPLSTSEDFPYGLPPEEYTITATRTALSGYQLGAQTDKPLASEAEAEALRTAVAGKQSALTAQQLANIAAVSDALAFDATHSYAAGDPVVYNGTLYTFTAEHTGAWTGSDVSAVDIIARLAGKLDKSGVVAPSTSASDSGKAADAKATGDALSHVDGKANHALGIAQQALATIPYTLGTPIVIDTASSEVVEGETVYYGAATLANRTANIVQVTAATPLDELRITFPAATSGKVRDFGLRVEIGTGSAALTAPALVPIAPTGETIKIENNAAEIPALADGTATAKGVTLLYSSENAPGVFVVKGEQVEEVA